MQQLCMLLIVFLLALTIRTYGQTDTRLCPTGPISVPDSRWRAIPPRFEIITELISGNEMMELSQAFANERDTIATTSRRGPINFYYNFATNEQFQVLTAVVNQVPISQCFRQEITSDSETSVIQPNSLVLKPSVLLGFDARNQYNPIWGNQYIGDEDLRGIPTNKFKSCFYVSDIKATVSATYYVSDPKKFQPNFRRNQTIILQINVNVRNQNGHEDSYQYNVFHFTSNPRRQEQRQALETPEGVYCPNRTATLAIPSNIPERLSSNSEVLIPQANGSIFSTHGLYDNEFQFTRYEVWYPDPLGGPKWYHYTEIHDFLTGLNYQYNFTSRRCNVRDIAIGSTDAVTVDGQPNLLQLTSTQHLFLLDDVTYQYTGEKRCRDRVWCHVWIAEKALPNNTIQHREWYWAARINDEPLREWIPMKLVLKGYTNAVLQYSLETHIFNFRRRPMTIFEIDFALSECYRALGPSEGYNIAVLSFKIANPKNYPVLENLNFLRLHIFEVLTSTMNIRPIRLSNLIVDKDGDDILVTFTVLDAAPRTGPVENPIKETSLDELIERLNSIINSDGLIFRAQSGTTQVKLRARANSLNVPHRSTIEKSKTSGGKITGLWLGFIFAGILVGTIGGFFVFGRFAK